MHVFGWDLLWCVLAAVNVDEFAGVRWAQRVYAATGRKDGARTALRRALQLRPADPRALEAMQQLGS